MKINITKLGLCNGCVRDGNTEIKLTNLGDLQYQQKCIEFMQRCLPGECIYDPRKDTTDPATIPDSEHSIDLIKKYGHLNQNKMEKEQVKIDIPEGKQPKMTTSDNGVYVEWVEKGKTWSEYVSYYTCYLQKTFNYGVIPAEHLSWPKLFKFGLLQYIADDLNEERLDWKNKTQTKAGLYYHHDDGRIGVDTYYRCHNAAMIFTVKAAEKAINIIPAEFLKTF